MGSKWGVGCGHETWEDEVGGRCDCDVLDKKMRITVGVGAPVLKRKTIRN